MRMGLALRRADAARLFFCEDQLAGGRQSRMQVECRTGDQNVQSKPQHADRLAFTHFADGREAHVGCVHDRHAAAALDFDGLVRADEGGCVFIETDAYGKRVVGQRGDQTAQAVTVTEVLVNDETIGESQPRREPHAAGDHRGALVAERDHVLAQNARARAGPADGDAVGIARANEFRHRRAAEQSREPQLVAAREEYAGRFLDPPQPPGLLAVSARVKIHYGYLGGAQVPEELFVARPGLVHAARGGNHDDIGVCAAGDSYETLQDVAIVFLILGAADGHDPTASLTRGNFTWHSAERSLERCGLQKYRDRLPRHSGRALDPE